MYRWRSECKSRKQEVERLKDLIPKSSRQVAPSPPQDKNRRRQVSFQASSSDERVPSTPTSVHPVKQSRAPKNLVALRSMSHQKTPKPVTYLCEQVPRPMACGVSNLKRHLAATDLDAEVLTRSKKSQRKSVRRERLPERMAGDASSLKHPDTNILDHQSNRNPPPILKAAADEPEEYVIERLLDRATQEEN